MHLKNELIPILMIIACTCILAGFTNSSDLSQGSAMSTSKQPLPSRPETVLAQNLRGSSGEERVFNRFITEEKEKLEQGKDKTIHSKNFLADAKVKLSPEVLKNLASIVALPPAKDLSRESIPLNTLWPAKKGLKPPSAIFNKIAAIMIKFNHLSGKEADIYQKNYLLLMSYGGSTALMKAFAIPERELTLEQIDFISDNMKSRFSLQRVYQLIIALSGDVVNYSKITNITNQQFTTTSRFILTALFITNLRPQDIETGNYLFTVHDLKKIKALIPKEPAKKSKEANIKDKV